uniref:Uncharacterized protein n=1 Tax=Oryza barthii TaxID=65489 RepID=A0A0D3F0L4_9ORYZ
MMQSSSSWPRTTSTPVSTAKFLSSDSKSQQYSVQVPRRETVYSLATDSLLSPMCTTCDEYTSVYSPRSTACDGRALRRGGPGTAKSLHPGCAGGGGSGCWTVEEEDRSHAPRTSSSAAEKPKQRPCSGTYSARSLKGSVQSPALLQVARAVSKE